MPQFHELKLIHYFQFSWCSKNDKNSPTFLCRIPLHPTKKKKKEENDMGNRDLPPHTQSKKCEKVLITLFLKTFSFLKTQIVFLFVFV